MSGRENLQKPAIASASADDLARLQSAGEGLQPAFGGEAHGRAAAPADDAQPAADAPEDAGLAAAWWPTRDERPCFRVLTEWKEHRGERYRPGVWHFGIKHGREGAPPTLTSTQVCGPLYVEAVTTDAQGGNFGRLLNFCDTLGKWHPWAMPMELLAATGDELRRELLAMGLELNHRAHHLLSQYLTCRTPNKRVLCVLSTGWASAAHDAFVLPARVIGPGADGVVYQGQQREGGEYAQAGTLDGWRDGVAALAVDNPMLCLALCAAFAGPVLALCGVEGGGVHLVGDSSTGKTTAVEVAASVWGGDRYRRSWRATANGMEGAAALFNDSLLVLDEISECDPRDVGAIVYALGNGYGKQRAGRTGAARHVARWRCMVLSSGERTIETTMAEVGQRQMAGHAVRLLDVAAGRTYGAWDALHGHASGVALSDAMKRAAGRHHGHAGPLLLAHLAKDGGQGLAELLEDFRGLPEFASGDDDSGQVRRAAGRFALLAMAGELATTCGATGWPKGEAVRACAVAFDTWRTGRSTGRAGNVEATQVAQALRRFIERHGDSRFSDADASEDQHRALPVRDRAGWWRRGDDGGRVYLFTSDGMREALRGFDLVRATAVLEAAGVLGAPGADGKRTRVQRVNGQRVRVYAANPEPLSRAAD